MPSMRDYTTGPRIIKNRLAAHYKLTQLGLSDDKAYQIVVNLSRKWNKPMTEAEIDSLFQKAS